MIFRSDGVAVNDKDDVQQDAFRVWMLYYSSQHYYDTSILVCIISQLQTRRK